MTARKAIELYKSRDASEKLFRSDKSYLGNKSMRVHNDEALSSKVFIQFIALILRSRIYTALKEKSEKIELSDGSGCLKRTGKNCNDTSA